MISSKKKNKIMDVFGVFLYNYFSSFGFLVEFYKLNEILKRDGGLRSSSSYIERTGSNISNRGGAFDAAELLSDDW